MAILGALGLEKLDFLFVTRQANKVGDRPSFMPFLERFFAPRADNLNHESSFLLRAGKRKGAALPRSSLGPERPDAKTRPSRADCSAWPVVIGVKISQV